jgi:AcrR family transcriptional regulator
MSSSFASSFDRVTRRLLDAALLLFARHGFQRTSLADVAAEAGVSRATLYLRFKDKQALFEGLAEALVTDTLAAAAAAWVAGAPFAANLEATLLAKDLPFYRLLHSSPHGAALLAVDAAVTRDQASRLDLGFVALLARRAAAADIDLEPFDGAEGFGRFLALAGAGLKHEAPSEEAYCAAVRRLCAVVARAALPRARDVAEAPIAGGGD